MSRIRLVQRRARQLGATGRAPRFAVHRQRDEEQAALILGQGRRTLIRRERHEGAKEVRGGPDVERCLGHRHDAALAREVPRRAHHALVFGDDRRGGRHIAPQLLHQLAPARARTHLFGDARELPLGFRHEPLAVAEELVGVLLDHVRRVQLAVEQVAADRHVGARLLLHLGERVAHLEQRRHRALACQAERLRVRGRQIEIGVVQPVANERHAPRDHLPRDLHEHVHRIGEHLTSVREELRNGLQSCDERARTMRRVHGLAHEQQEESAERMRDVEGRIARERTLALEHEEIVSRRVQRGRAVDLVFQGVGLDALEAQRVALERRGELADALASEVAQEMIEVVSSDVRRLHRVESPAEIEITLEDRADRVRHALAGCLRYSSTMASSSSSRSTRSMRLAASNT